MTLILGFVFAVASTVTALAMLLLVVWQAPRHRHNRLMAVYLATLVVWGASNLTARLCAGARDGAPARSASSSPRTA